ncbi:MAG: transcriptional repressor [Ruminococcaceae bacterium]|nr:transcriptional repressor [Oscillospiraceae bacterium]
MERRSTKQLQAIRRFTESVKTHPTAEEVYNVIVKEIPDISLRTVYRNLNKLSDEGYLRKIQVPNAPDRFDSTLEAHQHILCTECGEFIDVFMNNEEKLLSEIHGLCGYEITGIDVVYRGICPECKTNKNNIEKGA